MSDKIQKFTQDKLRKDLPEIRSGDKVRVYQKIKEESKGKERERLQAFEGTVIAIKHGKGVNATVTVRGNVENVGVERIFPLHSPAIDHIEVVAKRKARRAKLYYLREKTDKEIRRKLKTRS